MSYFQRPPDMRQPSNFTHGLRELTLCECLKLFFTHISFTINVQCVAFGRRPSTVVRRWTLSFSRLFSFHNISATVVSLDVLNSLRGRDRIIRRYVGVIPSKMRLCATGWRTEMKKRTRCISEIDEKFPHIYSEIAWIDYLVEHVEYNFKSSHTFLYIIAHFSFHFPSHFIINGMASTA